MSDENDFDDQITPTENCEEPPHTEEEANLRLAMVEVERLKHRIDLLIVERDEALERASDAERHRDDLMTQCKQLKDSLDKIRKGKIKPKKI